MHEDKEINQKLLITVNEYNDPHGKPVQLCEKVRKRITHKAKKVLVLHRKGVDLLFGDVLKIKKELSK